MNDITCLVDIETVERQCPELASSTYEVIRTTALAISSLTRSDACTTRARIVCHAFYSALMVLPCTSPSISEHDRIDVLS